MARRTIIRSEKQVRLGWDVLRSIGNSPLAKSAVMVPVLGYFLLFNEQVITWLRTHAHMCADCSIPWRLQCLYLAGWAFTLAAVIYAAKCPAMVKKYPSASDYLAGERATMNAHAYGTARDIVSGATREDVEFELMELKEAGEVYWTGKAGNSLDLILSVRESDSEIVQDAIGIVAYERLTESEEGWRFVLLMLYAIGAGLLAAPSIATLWVIGGQIGRDIYTGTMSLVSL